MKQRKDFFASSCGFTLIELLIAVGLFSVVVAIAVGGFARALRMERQTRLLLASNGSASIMLEAMAREIRTASSGSISVDAGGGTLSFVNAHGRSVLYRAESGALEKNEGGAGFYSLSGESTSVVNLRFSVRGSSVADGYPPRVTVSLSAAPSSTDPALSGSRINLQTTVSSRLMDDRPPTLLVRKFAPGGGAPPENFTVVVVGSKVRPCPPLDPSMRADAEAGACGDLLRRDSAADVCSFQGSNAGQFVTLAAGAYCADELPPGPDYNKTLGADCAEQAIRGGDYKACDITNNYCPAGSC